MENNNTLNAIPVFNFNYSTIMLFRCSESIYNKTFINGEMHFSQPEFWIEKGEKGNNTQGDKLEGIFLTTLKNDNSKFINDLKKDVNIETIIDKELIHFRRKSIKKLYTLCFYGLKDNSFNEKVIDNNGIAHYYARVKEDYFLGFSEIKNAEEYENLDESKKSSVVFIYNQDLLFSKIKDKLINEFKLKESEIIISPVEYIDKRKSAISLIPYPMELLLKDKSYENQSEVRIIINTENQDFINYMENNKGNIYIDSIEEFTKVHDYYFKDLLIERPKKDMILYTLPHPENKCIEDMTLDQILKEYIKIKTDKKNNWVKGNQEEFIKYLEELLEEKYKVSIIENENGKFNFCVNDNSNFELLQKENHKEITQNIFNNKIQELINNKKYAEAIKEMKEEKDKINEDSINFYIGKIYEEMGRYETAIDKYTECINKEMRKEDSLNARAICYMNLKKYSNAISDWNDLQEIIGYNEQIYSNIGIGLIYLENFKEAIENFNKSIAIKEVNLVAYYNRGVAYYKINEFKKFNEDIKKAIEYEPNNQLYIETYENFYGKV